MNNKEHKNTLTTKTKASPGFNKKTIVNMIEKLIQHYGINIAQLAAQTNIKTKLIREVYMSTTCSEKALVDVSMPIIRLYCKARWEKC